MPARRAASRRTSRILCATSDRADERRYGPAHSKLRFALIVIPSLPRCAQLCPRLRLVCPHAVCGCVGLIEVTGHTYIYIVSIEKRTCFPVLHPETPSPLHGCRGGGGGVSACTVVGDREPRRTSHSGEGFRIFRTR